MGEPHAITQARLRYGLELTEADLASVTALCRSGKASVLLKRQVRHLGPTEWRLVRYRGIAMVVVWNAITGAIITFLPPNATDANSPARLLRKRQRRCRRPLRHEREEAGGG